MTEYTGTFRRKFGKIIVFIIIVIMLTAAMARLGYQFFSIQTIQVVGSNVRAVVDQQKIPKNLLFFPSDKFRSEILATNLLLSDVRFVKLYPHTLIIIPVPRVPFARVRSGDRLVFVDATGIVLGEADNGSTLPLLDVQNIAIHTGEELTDNRISFLLQFVKQGSSLIPMSLITSVTDRQFLVKTDKTDIYITQDKSVSGTIATLQTLIEGFRIKGTLPSVVDLRFDKPVVKF